MARRIPTSWTFAAVIVALLAATSFALFPARDEPRGPLVLAAASLQEAMEAVADAWQARRHPRPVLSFAGTPALARQIEAGGPADLFISADEQWMDELARKDTIRHRTRASFLGNSLVIVELATKNTELDLTAGEALAQALGGGRLAMADPNAVPAGRYAKQALTSLRVWPEIKPRIVGTENVRIAQTLVSLGEAPFGVVYKTDAHAEPKLRIVANFPASSHVPITYPLALLETSQHSDAEGFRQFLLSAEAGAIFRRFGFVTEVRK
ncbi:MAG: molybdate ABC transporter substrate-binding protein [Novosphingobium sp.]|nr:molybdate ABC transporter substrate-binding protein [Novosphingobium sp.]